MIARPTIEKWRAYANWPLAGQVEQDLVISRALVDLFNHSYLRKRLAFRGGTALHKLVFPKGLRYSEDIDLNRLEEGPAKPIIDGVREALSGMLGQPKKVKSTKNSVKIIYDYDSIDGGTSRLKVEINTRETLPQRPLLHVPFTVDSDYFSGSTTVASFSVVEMISTKIRALYQRKKGRDLFDLYELSKLSMNWDEIVQSFKELKLEVSQLAYSNNLKLKISDKAFLEDIKPLLPIGHRYDPHEAYDWFAREIIPKL